MSLSVGFSSLLCLKVSSSLIFVIIGGNMMGRLRSVLRMGLFGKLKCVSSYVIGVINVMVSSSVILVVSRLMCRVFFIVWFVSVG